MRKTTLSGIAAVTTAVVSTVGAVPAVAGTERWVPCDTTALSSAIATAPATSTLVLAHHCTYHLRLPDGPDGLPLIDKQLTIHGRDATVVRDGQTSGRFRIFHVASAGELRLDNITIRGGYAPNSPTQQNGDGGGILVDGKGRLELADSTLDNNTADNDGGGVAVGEGATADITGSRFTFNNAGNTGGGLQSDGTVTTDGVAFERNVATSNGGGIDHDLGDAIYRNTVLKHNTTAGTGGGIDIDAGSVEFINSRILNNTTTTQPPAPQPGGPIPQQGGGISNFNAKLSLYKTEVSGNVAAGDTSRGGGIYNDHGNLVLEYSPVRRNSANGTGSSQAGGIYNTGGTVTLAHSDVENNASTTAPGGVYTDTAVQVNRSVIRRNIPTNCAGSPVIVGGCIG